jgi:hypothetical protein
MEQARHIFERDEGHGSPRAEGRPAVRRELRQEAAGRPERGRPSGHVDQLMAAAASVVWLAGFIQSIVDEITGEEGDDL